MAAPAAINVDTTFICRCFIVIPLYCFIERVETAGETAEDQQDRRKTRNCESPARHRHR
jgi:hypothetical protein